MTINPQQNEHACLKHPAWTSVGLNIASHPTKEAQFALIQTKNTIFDRVEILRENSESITIKYKTIERGASMDRTETIKKRDIIVRRNYVN